MNTFNPSVKLVSTLYWLYKDHQPMCRKTTMDEINKAFAKARTDYPASYLNVVMQTSTTQDIMEHHGKAPDRIKEFFDA